MKRESLKVTAGGVRWRILRKRGKLKTARVVGKGFIFMLLCQLAVEEREPSC